MMNSFVLGWIMLFFEVTEHWVTPVFHLLAKSSLATDVQIQMAANMSKVEEAFKATDNSHRLDALEQALAEPMLEIFRPAHHILKEKLAVIVVSIDSTEQCSLHLHIHEQQQQDS